MYGHMNIKFELGWLARVLHNIRQNNLHMNTFLKTSCSRLWQFTRSNTWMGYGVARFLADCSKCLFWYFENFHWMYRNFSFVRCTCLHPPAGETQVRPSHFHFTCRARTSPIVTEWGTATVYLPVWMLWSIAKSLINAWNRSTRYRLFCRAPICLVCKTTNFEPRVYCPYLFIFRIVPFKADSHITCCAHAVSLPCRAVPLRV